MNARGVAPDDCISEIGRLVTDASLHTTYHFNDNIILHMVKLT
ncbi:MAG: hypothetical protein R3B89_28220 [Polyangiaceae bacterium]